MDDFLSQRQRSAQAEFRAFAEAEIAPRADEFDRQERISSNMVRKLAAQKYLGAVLPAELGGMGLDMISFGLLNEEVGRACSSVRSLLTVHSMVASAILRWGSDAQKSRWLPALATGECIGAFALTEPNFGSDAKSIETTAERDGDRYVLSGRKMWITYAQIADVFVVLAQLDGRPTAFLVERSQHGLTVEPVTGMIGTRASMLGELHFDRCSLPQASMISGEGFGFTAVAMSALDLGRYTVGWGCVGIGQACLDASLKYAAERTQFGRPLKDHQLVKEMIANMVTDVKAARLLCCQAGRLKDAGASCSTAETLIAKYFSSRMAFRVASDAVQIHGANGCSSRYPVQRYLRDAKVMEIIEGSNQMQQLMICSDAFSAQDESPPRQ